MSQRRSGVGGAEGKGVLDGGAERYISFINLHVLTYIQKVFWYAEWH
jgi:hypothetical protein